VLGRREERARVKTKKVNQDSKKIKVRGSGGFYGKEGLSNNTNNLLLEEERYRENHEPKGEKKKVAEVG